MAYFKKTEARLRQIKRRQWKQRWGSTYVASIFADAREAPGISTGTILRPVKLGEREFHTLSEPETFCSLLALHHCDCWDAHEQVVLFPTPREHPLAGHPAAGGERFQSFAGTLEVADRMRLLRKHPRLRLHIGTDPRSWPMAPFPLIGDLRLFMRDAQGVYAVNWTVKNKYSDFRRKAPGAKPRPLKALDDPTSIARQELEKQYHTDAGIRTQLASKDQLDTQLCWNLRNTFLEDARPIDLEGDRRAEALEMVRSCIGLDVPGHEVARRLAKEFHISPEDGASFIYQGAWRRELRLDFFRPILMTRPLRAEVVDVLDKFAQWFSR